MHHMDVPIDYQTDAKAGQRNAEIKDCFVDDTECFASRVH